MEYVTRINLKTSTNYRKELIEYCLLSKQQNLAIGWSCVYKNSDFSNFEDYYYAGKMIQRLKAVNPSTGVLYFYVVPQKMYDDDIRFEDFVGITSVYEFINLHQDTLIIITPNNNCCLYKRQFFICFCVVLILNIFKSNFFKIKFVI